MQRVTIGAGNTVGYKSASSWAVKIEPKSQKKPDAFLYLEYLKIDI